MQPEDGENEQVNGRVNLQASYSSIISEYRIGLLQWLEKDSESEDNDFEDRVLDALLFKIETFQEQPNLLDSSLQSLIEPLIPSLLESVYAGFNIKRQNCFKVIYYYTKIRGYKVTIRFLPNEVYLLEPVLAALSTPNLQWQTTYILLLWLSLICLAPFDLASIESSDGEQSLVTRLLETAKRGLRSGGKERDACAILCARVLSRDDVWRTELPPFIIWAIDVFSAEDNLLLKTGLLSAISNVLAHSTREIGRSIIPQTMAILRLTKSDEIQSSAITRKLRVKIMQRVGMIEIPASNRRHEIEIPESLEEVIDFLLSSLSDKDTIVRYTAAKAVSRIVMSLPTSFSNEIISSLFQNMDEGLVQGTTEWDFSSVDENTWHGCLLCLADIAWNAGIQGQNIGPAITYSLNALTFDFIKGQKPVGNAVRDAACYVLYSLVRTVPPKFTESSLETWILDVAVQLVCVATLDPSTTIRRAASAAYQELVGRQSSGNDRVPHGITVLSMMDYHAVGSRRGGFEVAANVALVDERYRSGVIEWCVARGVGHWEERGREGVAKVLGRIFSSNREGIVDVLQRLMMYLSELDVLKIHGSLLAIGELILTLTHEESVTNSEFYQTIQLCIDKLPAYTKKSVHANLVLIASLRFIQCICDSHLPISTISMQSYIRLMESVMHKNTDAVQQTASEALGSISRRIDISNHLQKWLGNLNRKTNFIVRRGWATALGYVHLSEYRSVLSILCDTVDSDGDVEVKRNAVKSIGLVFTKLETFTDGALVTRVWSLLTACLEDYTVDSRGDVGSWIRMAACESLVPVLRYAFQEDIHDTVGKLLRLSVEKMDRVRVVAGKTLCTIIPHWSDAASALKEIVEWADKDIFAVPSKLYPAAVQLLSLDRYREELLTGFVVSAGGLGESLTRTASVALADYFDLITDEDLILNLKCLERIFRINVQNDRVIIPAIDATAGLLEESIFHRISDVYDFRQIFILTQKIGYKSGNVIKIIACVRMYAALLSIEAIRQDVLKKMLAMLLHPLPRVRVVVADALFVNLEGEEEGRILGEAEWSSDRDALKADVRKLEEFVLAK